MEIPGTVSNSLELSHSSEADSRSASDLYGTQRFITVLTRVRHWLQMSPVHTFSTDIFLIRFNIHLGFCSGAGSSRRECFDS
jgi:hypothetical protein